jgi:hypothetical protein
MFFRACLDFPQRKTVSFHDNQPCEYYIITARRIRLKAAGAVFSNSDFKKMRLFRRGKSRQIADGNLLPPPPLQTCSLHYPPLRDSAPQRPAGGPKATRRDRPLPHIQRPRSDGGLVPRRQRRVNSSDLGFEIGIAGHAYFSLDIFRQYVIIIPMLTVSAKTTHRAIHGFTASLTYSPGS